MLIIRKGTKILKPLAALKPIPIKIVSNISKSIFVYSDLNFFNESEPSLLNKNMQLLE
jgi:hypothetical protein